MIDNEAFKRDFAKILQKAGDKAEMVVRKTALQLQSSMIEMSPVDTGRFRGNWQCGIGSINANAGDAPHSDALGRTVAKLPEWKVGKTIWLTNSLPYAHVLEFGRENGKPGSMQAPNGMVRITVQNYATALAAAARSIQ